jgi:molybdenum cofactor cytidylyltransferase
MEIRVSAGGRVNLHATEHCCLLLDEELLRWVNLSGCLTIATGANYSYAEAGSRVATFKTAPFAVRRSDCDSVLDAVLKQGPLIQARPIRDPVVGVLYTDPRKGDRARELFEAILSKRLLRLGANEIHALTALENEPSVAHSLDYLLRAKLTLLLVASTTAPAGPGDVVGRALDQIGCRTECFMAPVEPGNLLLLAYAGDVPVVAAPGCFRWSKPNVLDLVLPPLLARYPLSAQEIASWGHRGLLQ